MLTEALKGNETESVFVFNWVILNSTTFYPNCFVRLENHCNSAESMPMSSIFAKILKVLIHNISPYVILESWETQHFNDNCHAYAITKHDASVCIKHLKDLADFRAYSLKKTVWEFICTVLCHSALYSDVSCIACYV